MSLIGYVLMPRDISTSNRELGLMLHCSGTFSLSTDLDKQQEKISFSDAGYAVGKSPSRGLLKEYDMCGQLNLRGEGQPPQTCAGKTLDTQYLKV